MQGLVLIDIQNDFVSRLKPRVRSRVLSATNELLELFSRSGLPIYTVLTEHQADGSDALPKAREEGYFPAVVGTIGAQPPSGLIDIKNPIMIKKQKYSAFFETNLSEFIDSRVDTLVFCGVNTHACVAMSAVDACQRSYGVIIAKDCVASYDSEYHRVFLRYLGSQIGDVLDNQSIVRSVK